MRSASQLQDISIRAKCGYVLLGQSMVTIREEQMLETTVYNKMFIVINLLLTIDNTYLSLKQRNAAADRLVREGVVVKKEVSEYWMQPEYTDDYVNFTS